MSLQQKFVLVISMLGMAVAGALVAAWWSFGTLQRELASPFAVASTVLTALGKIKRSVEEQALIINSPGRELTDADRRAQFGLLMDRLNVDGSARWRQRMVVRNRIFTQVLEDQSELFSPTMGVRGVMVFVPHRPSEAERRKYSDLEAQIARQLVVLDSRDGYSARIGVSTYRNLKTRLAGARELAVRWFKDEDPLARAAVSRGQYDIHELIEQTEMRILDDAKSAVTFGEYVGRLLRWLLVSVFASAVLGGILSVVLLRRWVLRPVRALRDAAARIASGDFQHRVPVLQRDELGLLSSEVNHMTGMVKEMQDERVERERLAAVGGMLRRVVHNVRNPLAGIRGLAEVTRLDMAKDSANRENMDLIVTTVDTFERWLSELLDSTSPAQIDPRECEVAPWINEVLEAHRSQAHSKGMTLAVSMEDAPATACFDPKHLDHALSALVSNAIEAAPTGTTVWVTAKRLERDTGQGGWEIEVADEGAGIPAQVLPRIFEPNFTTKRHGSGLGLAMAQQIVKDHSGRISVRNGGDASAPKRGAIFTIRMPGGVCPKHDVR